MKALILLITSTLVIMADFVIAPILPKIQEAFSDTQHIELLSMMVLTTPALFIMLSSPIIGYFADKYGKKTIVLAGIFVYVTAGTAGYFADSIYELLFGRAIFGIAITAVITGCSALITDNYRGDELSRMMGLQSAFIGYGGIIYIVLGGIVADTYWKNTFLVYLSPLIFLFLFAIYVDEPKGNTKSICYMPVFEIKKYTKIYLAAFALMIFFYMIPLQIPFYLKSIEPHISNSQIGITLALVSLFSATMSIFYKNIKKRTSFRSLFIIPFGIMGLGYIVVSLYPDYIYPVMGLIITGIGMGMVIPNLRVWVGHISDICVSGRAFGGLTTSFYFGQIVSPLVIVSINGNFTIAGAMMIALAAAYSLFSRKSNAIIG